MDHKLKQEYSSFHHTPALFFNEHTTNYYRWIILHTSTSVRWSHSEKKKEKKIEKKKEQNVYLSYILSTYTHLRTMATQRSTPPTLGAAEASPLSMEAGQLCITACTHTKFSLEGFTSLVVLLRYVFHLYRIYFNTQTQSIGSLPKDTQANQEQFALQKF